MDEPNSNRTIIVGAGAAGLAAAHELGRAGRTSLVLEARSRIGGRIYTDRKNSLTFPLELGAEFVHGRSTPTFKLVDEGQLSLTETPELHWGFENGRYIKSGEFWQEIENLMGQMNPVLPDQSFSEFLESLPDTGQNSQAKVMAVMFVEGFHAADTKVIGVHGLIEDREAAEQMHGDESFRIIEGYDKLISYLETDSLANGASLQLDAVVNEIRWDSSPIQVNCRVKGESATFLGQDLLITLPLGVLQSSPDVSAHVSFIPELPEWKRQAIEHLRMGYVAKIALLFKSRFWEDIEGLSDLTFLHSPETRFHTWWTQLPKRVPVLIGWAGGGQLSALHTNDKSELLSDAITSLAQLFRTTSEEISKLMVSSHVHNWSLDPYSLGAYSYLPVNGLDSQILLGKPVDDRLFFAGEATAVGHIGTVHGAIVSGQRAAREILVRDRRR